VVTVSRRFFDKSATDSHWDYDGTTTMTHVVVAGTMRCNVVRTCGAEIKLKKCFRNVLASFA